MNSYTISSIIVFHLQSYYLMNNHSVSSTFILFDEQSYCFIICFKFIKTCYYSEKKHNKKTYIIFLVLSSHSFRGLEGLVVSWRCCLCVRQINTLKIVFLRL